MITHIGGEMQASDVIRLTPIVEPVAKSFSRSYPGTDAEDILQEIWLHFIKEWKHYEGKEDAYILVGARKVATTYCKTELYSYQLHSSQYVYTPNDVRALFKEAYFEDSNWEVVPGRDDNRLTVTDSNGVTVALWDLRTAFEALSESDQVWIIRAYCQGEELEKSQQKAVQRAIDRCTEQLNRKVPRAKRSESFDNITRTSGSRPSSRQAQAMLGDDY